MPKDYEEVGLERERRTFGGFFRRHRIAVTLVVIVTIAIVVLTTAFAVHYARKGDNPSPTPGIPSLPGQVKTENIVGHLTQLNNIAMENNGTRASGTSGYLASVNYVYDTLKANTNYEVWVQNFTYPVTTLIEKPVLSLVEPKAQNFTYKTDFEVMGAPPGPLDITGLMQRVPVLGCYDDDWTTFEAGNIALVVRGECPFQQKADLANKYNASAAILYNDGASGDRIGLLGASVVTTKAPIFFASFLTGLNLNSQVDPVTVFVSTWNQGGLVTTFNVIADTARGNPDSVIVVGSHLDSVPAGPGINDNGSGSSLNLELAIQLYKSGLINSIESHIRFCWWGGEELGLLGSAHYVADLVANYPEEKAKIVLNLNFDMVGSPNFFRGIYNGTSGPSDIVNGSAAIQYLFEDSFNARNLKWELTSFDGRSDYGPFINNGIPAGGLATGAEGIKTIQQRTFYGGLANAWYDPCYHQACDNIDNINQGVLGDMAFAAAEVLQTLSLKANVTDFFNDH
eukprot:TRINITY_DN789_c0_g1_i2.p2 TRINITY_DN789_c0_g1~~TRINITY_DN789_c0_g1_i2.p2  ORF type:complete len:512 (+),score=153.81 TRINITY_DN789_c0_g1_i2:42-1577(+)